MRPARWFYCIGLSSAVLGLCMLPWMGCGTCFSGGRPTVLQPAIMVVLTDSLTGQPIDAGNARIVATSGEYRTDLISGVGAYRPGTYTIEVYLDGYAPARQEGVVVEEDLLRCGAYTSRFVEIVVEQE